jgi:3',5'-cyclic AMP phosphodiesterase CpdA
MIVIAQITDLHIDGPDGPNARRLERVLTAIAPYRPAAIIASGDLTDHGAPAEYDALATLLRRAPAPVHLALGNHDRRQNFLSRFPNARDGDGFVQYAVALGGARLVVCDTLEEGQEGGGFCDRRALWLAQRLSEDLSPTLIALHHPPIVSHLEWMDGARAARAWAARFGDVLVGRGHVKVLLSGHLHRPMTGMFQGVVSVTAPACAPQLALDFAPLDKARPDGRVLVQDEPPGFVLHMIDGANVASHVVHVGDFPSVGRFTAPMVA